MTTTAARVLRRFLPAAGLLVLAPFCGEYLVGSISIRSLPALPFLVPLYGAAALLIRESARRTGRGWRTMLLLGAAFGVFQAGIVDASLFNRSFQGMDLDGAQVPLLDFSAVFGLAFVMNHVMISIGGPIAVVEALAPGGEGVPWLGRIGLAITGLIYLGGSALIGWDCWVQERFYPSPLQLTCAAVVVTGLVGAAFARPRPRSAPLPRSSPLRRSAALRRSSQARSPETATAPRPDRVGTAAALITGGFFFVPPNWAGFALGGFLIGLLARLVSRWSRATGWNVRHRLALAAGSFATAAWGAFFVDAFTGQDDLLTRAGHVLFAVAVAGLLTWSFRSRSADPTRRRGNDAVLSASHHDHRTTDPSA